MTSHEASLPFHKGEERLKALVFEGVAQERSDKAFNHLNSHLNDTLRQLLHKDVFQPSTEDVLANDSKTEVYRQQGRVKVLIPMRELEANIAPVIGDIIDELSDYIGAENIFISDNGLHEKVRDSIIARGITLISVEKMKERFDFPKLLEILALKELNYGLGFSMMSGLAYLAVEQRIQPDDWLVKFDGDITNFKQCLLPQYLLHPLAIEPNREWDYLKIAKVGRNNETVIAGINSLTSYFRSKIESSWGLAPQVQVAWEIYEACIRQIWILSGQYGIRWKHLYEQLAATNYCDPLLSSAQLGWRNFAQIINSHPLLDMPNTKQKEDCMISLFVQFINTLVVFGKSIRDEWSIEDIARFNRDFAQHQNAVVWIPEEPEPMRLENIEPDRLMPSLKMLIQEGLLS